MAEGVLRLSNGEVLRGRVIGSPKSSSGELVFTTALVGYSEALTDASYFGQILVFAYPLIGNYGVPAFSERLEPEVGHESKRIHAAGVIVGTACNDLFAWNAKLGFEDWLREQGIIGLAGVDTRHLIEMIRREAPLFGRIEVKEGAQTADFYDPGLENVLPRVSTSARIRVGPGSKRVAVIDCGVKWNIVRELNQQGCEVEILPWDTDFRTVDCSGWLISNGPGDPAKTGDLQNRVASILKMSKPVLGICLGHQILALAAGAKTEKMSYGHRSHNQPVVDLESGRAFLTSQNHGYVVKKESIPEGWNPWFFNLNDQSVEGLCHCEKPFMSVQFHPEASAGPRDTHWIFEKFVSELRN